MNFPPITENSHTPRGRISGSLKKQLLDRHFRISPKCHWCPTITIRNPPGGDQRQAANTATLDHLISRTESGPDTFENTVLACARCNNTRGAATLFLVTHRRMHQAAPNRLFGVRIQNGHAI